MREGTHALPTLPPCCPPAPHLATAPQPIQAALSPGQKLQARRGRPCEDIQPCKTRISSLEWTPDSRPPGSPIPVTHAHSSLSVKTFSHKLHPSQTRSRLSGASGAASGRLGKGCVSEGVSIGYTRPAPQDGSLCTLCAKRRGEGTATRAQQGAPECGRCVIRCRGRPGRRSALREEGLGSLG